MEPPFHIAALKEELTRRIDRNPSYSLRAFAKSLDLDPANLSKVLSGKVSFSTHSANKVTSKLELSPSDRDNFINSVRLRKQNRIVAPSTSKFNKLKHDWFEIAGDWYHYAIVELTQVEDFEPTPSWIAGRLGISEIAAKLAIDRLLNVGLIAWKNDTLKKVPQNYTTEDKSATTHGLRKLQRQIMEKAIESLEQDPLPRRVVGSTTMAISADKVDEARDLIFDFMRKLSSLLEKGANKEVYNLNISLYPLERK